MSLMKFERRWAEAVFDGLFPAKVDARVPMGARDADMVGLFEDAREAVPPRVALGLRIALWLVALAPLFTIGKLVSIGGLEGVDRERVLLALLSSPLYFVRQLTLLLKTFGALFFFSAPGVREAIVHAPNKTLVKLGMKKELSHERSVA